MAETVPSRNAKGCETASMAKLKPMYLYRLRLIVSAPRFYAPGAVNAYLERRGLIARTGRVEADERIEFAITGAGREALAAADRV